MHKRTPSHKSPRKYSEKKLNSRKSMVKKRDMIQRQSLQPSVSSASGPLEDYQPSAGLFEEKQDVDGGDMFQVTPLKSKKILKDASPSIKSLTNTPKALEENNRQRMKQELSRLSNLQLESDPEDSDENNDSDYEDIESEEDERPVLDADAIKRRGKNAKTFPETYFSAQKQKKTATSNRTLSSLKLERTDMDQLSSILRNAPDNHKKEKDLMFKRYKAQFIKWNFLLHHGFNVLLYGVGSKQKLLNLFCEEYLDGSLYVVVHGFFPSLNFKQILTSITEDALGSDRKFSNIHEHSEFVREYFSKGKEEVYLIIHNIDGIALRNVKTQMLLSSLASVPNIHLLCSIDHINSPLIWDQIMLSQLRWVWMDTTTFEPYVVETSYENSIFRDQSSHLLLSSLLHVYRSLTPNGQSVFRILANHQSKDKGFTGLPFHEWYNECREEFLVNSEITMQAQLSEFKNHKLLTSKKSMEGAEVWFIPVDSITLEQFLESCK